MLKKADTIPKNLLLTSLMLKLENLKEIIDALYRYKSVKCILYILKKYIKIKKNFKFAVTKCTSQDIYIIEG